MRNQKESGDYLAQIRNNAKEKVGVLEGALREASLPADSNNRTKILELGTGGGESLRLLRGLAKNNGHEIDIIATDIIPSLVASLKKEGGVEGVAADAGHLPFANNSISAVNASAIFHEVSSYGTLDTEEKKISDSAAKAYGPKAVIRTLAELQRVLLPGGVLAYRDVLAPLQNLQETKSVEYSRPSFKHFIDWFLSGFLKAPVGMYNSDAVEISHSAGGLVLSAPVGLQREVQRHYLMLRDYLRTVKHEAFGISMLRSDWIKEKNGLKSITFAVNEQTLPLVDTAGFEVHKSADGVIYKGDSDRFDEMYDSVMAKYFSGEQEALTDQKDFFETIDDWKHREGSEYYLYGNFSDMLNFAVEASDKTDRETILFPREASDITIAPRYYYNRYLSQTVDRPEMDGKQIIEFRKIPRKGAPLVLEQLGISSLAGAFISKLELATLKEKLRVGA